MGDRRHLDSSINFISPVKGIIDQYPHVMPRKIVFNTIPFPLLIIFYPGLKKQKDVLMTVIAISLGFFTCWLPLITMF